jgi:hypothetical protein
MNPVTKAALATLRSVDFFAHLRGAMTRAGLAGEEKFGVGVFFVLVSRFLRRPLRLAINEATERGAKYLLRKASNFARAGTVRNVFSEQGWSNFEAEPENKVAYVPQWCDWAGEGTRIEIAGNRLTRVLKREHDGRVIESPHTVEAPFVCVSTLRPIGRFGERVDTGRWLTIKLPAPPPSDPRPITPLDDEELMIWFEVQRLVQERGKAKVVLPDWTDVVIEHACQNERAALHLPAFLESWKTMTLLRSFRRDRDGQQLETLRPNFGDLAATGMLLSGVFQEGRLFPSPTKIFNEVFQVGKEGGVINPLTGKGVRYTRRPEQTAASKYVGFETIVSGWSDVE